MASNRAQGGIQQLLAAEQEAQHIVNAARSGKLAVLYGYVHILMLSISRSLDISLKPQGVGPSGGGLALKVCSLQSPRFNTS
jgi:hypothetical protein